MIAPLKDPAPTSTVSIGQRLKQAITKRGMPVNELARRAEVKPSFIYDIINGKSANPSTVKLARVANNLGIGMGWLAGTSEHATEHVSISLHTPHGDYIAIPSIVADTPAGGGTTVSQERGGECYYFSRAWIREHLLANPDELRMLCVQGDSMEPTLCHNDRLIIDTKRKLPSPPGIFVLFDGFGLMAKRLEHVTHHNQPHLCIISDNPEYPAYECPIDETSIIGRVVWFARAM
jgi:phage repressor protein C with HTH and peptisase S24 domain